MVFVHVPEKDLWIFQETDADIFCIQETKMQEGQLELDTPGYHQYWNYAKKKRLFGDSNIYQAGTNQRKLRTWNRGARPGRACDHMEFEDFYFITVYTPNSQSELARLDYRMKWEEDFLTYLKKLEETKPVIFCGDLNVAHTEIDLKNPKTNRKNAGFTDEERQKFTELLNAGFVDTFGIFIRSRQVSTLVVLQI